MIAFKSVKKLKESTEEEIEQVVGKQKAGIIHSYFQKLKSTADETH